MSYLTLAMALRIIRNPVFMAVACILAIMAYGAWERHVGAVACVEEVKRATARVESEWKSRTSEALEMAAKRERELREMEKTARRIYEDAKDHDCDIPDDVLGRLRQLDGRP